MKGMLILSIAVGIAVIAVGAILIARLSRGRCEDAGVGWSQDATGRRVRLIDPWPMYALGRHGAIDTEALERIAEDLEPGVRRRRRLLWVASAFVLLTILGVLLAVAIEGGSAWADLASTVTNPAILAAVVGGSVAPWIATRKERLQRVKRVMLRHRCCPHCGYGLTGVPAAPDDGTTTCPECACAWRLDDTPSPAAPGPANASRPVALLLMLTALTGLAVLGTFVYLAMR